MASLEPSKALFEQIFEQTADFIKITDKNGTIIFVNKALTERTGYNESELIGKTPAVLKHEMRDAEKAKHLWDTIMAGDVYKNCIVNRCKDGSTYYESTTISPIFDTQGNIEYYVSTGKDMSEFVRLQQKLSEMAMKDPLTGLCNRRSLHDRLLKEKTRVDRYGTSFGMMMLDIDHFKTINDQFGHDVGDETLVTMAKLLNSLVRESDMVARWGGEEFIIMVMHIDENGLAQLSEKLRQEVANMVFPSSEKLTISLGMTLYKLGEPIDTLLKRLDCALYDAKDGGRNCVRSKF